MKEKKRDVDGVQVVYRRYPDMNVKTLRELGDELLSKAVSDVIVLGSIHSEKVALVVAVERKVSEEKGLDAVSIVRKLARIVGGGGGGRELMAWAGGKETAKLDEALEASFEAVESEIRN